MFVLPDETAVDGLPLGPDVDLLQYLLHEVLLGAGAGGEGVRRLLGQGRGAQRGVKLLLRGQRARPSLFRYSIIDGFIRRVCFSDVS